MYNYAIFCEEKRGDASHAADLYRRVLQIDPEDTDALNNYALLLQHHTQDLAEAKALLLRALQAEPLELATSEACDEGGVRRDSVGGLLGGARHRGRAVEGSEPASERGHKARRSCWREATHKP